MRRTLPLRAYYVASFAVGGVYMPFFPQWLASRGMHGAGLGLIVAAWPGMGIVAPTALGVVADALQLRRGLLQIACGGALVAFGALTAAAARGLPLGFSQLLLAAVAIALFRSPMVMMMDVVAIEHAPRVGTTYGRLRLWGSVGFMAAVSLAGPFVDPKIHPLALPWICTGLVAAAFLCSLALPRHAELPRRDGGHRVLLLATAPDFLLFLAVMFLGQCGHAAYDMCFSMHLRSMGVSQASVGVAWAIGVAAEVILMAASARIFRNYPASALLVLALGAAALRWMAIAAAHSTLVLFALQPLHALSYGLMWLAGVSYTSHRFPTDRSATAQGLLVTATGLGSVAGMLLWAPLFARAGGAFMFAGAACFAVCGCACAFALDRRVRAPVQSTPSPAPNPPQPGTTVSN